MYTTLLEDVIIHMLTGMPSGETQFRPAIMQQLQKATNTVIFVTENISGNSYGEKQKEKGFLSKLFE